MVFNQKYNAGHWNDLGAFYGVNNILEAFKKDFLNIHINSIDEYKLTQKLNTSLPVSKFPILEYEPIFELKNPVLNITTNYVNEVKLHQSYRYFNYWINEQRVREGAPKALVFQGSYMNGMGYKFLMNSLGEYIAVHDYQNAINFSYYFNLFQPECVVFEVAEYTFTNNYFDYNKMTQFKLNPVLESFKGFDEYEATLDKGSLKVVQGKAITTITVDGLPGDFDYAYLTINDKVYDLMPEESDDGTVTYTVSISNDDYEESTYRIITIDKKKQKKSVYLDF